MVVERLGNGVQLSSELAGVLKEVCIELNICLVKVYGKRSAPNKKHIVQMYRHP